MDHSTPQPASADSTNRVHSLFFSILIFSLKITSFSLQGPQGHAITDHHHIPIHDSSSTGFMTPDTGRVKHDSARRSLHDNFERLSNATAAADATATATTTTGSKTTSDESIDAPKRKIEETKEDSDEKIKHIKRLEEEVIKYIDSTRKLRIAMEELGVPQQADDPLFKDIIELNEVAFVNQLRELLSKFRLNARMGVLEAVIKIISTGEFSLLNGQLETLDVEAMKLQMFHLHEFIRDTALDKNILENIVREEMKTLETIFAKHRRTSDEPSGPDQKKPKLQSSKADVDRLMYDIDLLAGRFGPTFLDEVLTLLRKIKSPHKLTSYQSVGEAINRLQMILLEDHRDDFEQIRKAVNQRKRFLQLMAPEGDEMYSILTDVYKRLKQESLKQDGEFDSRKIFEEVDSAVRRSDEIYSTVMDMLESLDTYNRYNQVGDFDSQKLLKEVRDVVDTKRFLLESNKYTRPIQLNPICYDPAELADLQKRINGCDSPHVLDIVHRRLGDLAPR